MLWNMCRGALVQNLDNLDLKWLHQSRNIYRYIGINYYYYLVIYDIMQLHWLPVEARVKFKTLCLAHHCINKEAPDYLCQMFTKNEPKTCSLRSVKSLYQVPKSRCKSFGDRAFSVNGPQSWNSLPKEIQNMEDFKLFKKELKTHLFQLSYH